MLQELQSELRIYGSSLPLVPCEPPDIIVAPAGEGVGRINASGFLPASSLSISRLRRRTHAGSVIAYVLAPRDYATIRGDEHAALLCAMAAATLFIVVLQPAFSDEVALGHAAAADLLPVAYESSASHGGVLISVKVPESLPTGSSVVVRRAFFAGSELVIDEADLAVTIGFCHDPAPAGLAWAAAEAGDASELLRLLEGGASTEEKNEVGSPSGMRDACLL
jgi:hypothetical protein